MEEISRSGRTRGRDAQNWKVYIQRKASTPKQSLCTRRSYSSRCSATATPTSTISLPTQMSIPIADLDSNVLRSVVEHVFMPPKLPQSGQDEKAERESNVAICHALIEAARNFLQNLPYSQRPQWGHMIKMMESVRRAAKFPFETAELQRTLSNMIIGGASI